MFIINAFVKSLSSWKWVAENRKGFGRALGYFVLLIAVVSIITLARGNLNLSALRNIKDKVYTKLPDFTAEIKGGELKLYGLEQPYVREFNNNEKNKGLIYIDTNNPIDRESVIGQYKDYNSIVVVNNSGATIVDNGGVRTQSFMFSKIPNYTFKKTDLEKPLNILQKLSGPLIALIYLLILIVMVIGWTIGKLIYLLITSLIFLIVAKIVKSGWNYGEIYTASLYSNTLPIVVVSIILSLLNYNKIPFLYTILLALMLIGSMVKNKTLATAQPISSSPPENTPVAS